MKIADDNANVVAPLAGRFIRRVANQPEPGVVPAPQIERREAHEAGERQGASLERGRRPSVVRHVPASVSHTSGAGALTHGARDYESMTPELLRPGSESPGDRNQGAITEAVGQAWIISDLTGLETLFHQATIVVTPQWSSHASAAPLPPALQGPHLHRGTANRGDSIVPVDAPTARNAFAPSDLGRAAASEVVTRRIDPPSRNAGDEWHQPREVPSVHRPRATQAPVVHPAPQNERQFDELMPPEYSQPDSGSSDDEGRTEPDDLPVAWEVDRWQWPADCQRLMNSLGEELREAGKQLAAAAEHGLRCLAITSGQRGEGRTTVAMLLARAAAEAGCPVALVEADFDNPQLANLLAAIPPMDWRQALQTAQPIDEAAIYSQQDKLVIAPLKREAREDHQPIALERWTRLISGWAAKHFSLTIVDIGSWSAALRRLSPEHLRSFQAAVVVRDTRSTTTAMLERLIREVLQSGIEAVGVIDNFVRSPTSASAVC